MASKPQYKEAYEKFIEFSEMVRLNGIKITKENYFSNVVVDFLKFVIYLEKCLLKSVVVSFNLLSRHFQGFYLWDLLLG